MGTSPTEYLYIDECRLTSYAEQVSSPVIYDKVPVWKTEGSLIGPKAEVTRARFARAATVHERIQILLAHLQKHGLLSSDRPSDKDCRGSGTVNPVFRHETFRASRIFFPPRSQAEKAFRGLRLWFSGYSAKMLYLMEDGPHSDRSVDSPYQTESHYSILQLLLHHYENEIAQTIAAPHLQFSPMELGSSASTSKPDLLFDLAKRLHGAGALLSKERLITSLYRIRDVFHDRYCEPFSVSTFAYPIFIAEADEKAHAKIQQEEEARVKAEMKRHSAAFERFIKTGKLHNEA